MACLPFRLFSSSTSMASILYLNHPSSSPRTLPTFDHLSRWKSSRNLILSKTISPKLVTTVKCSSASSLSLDPTEDKLIKDSDQDTFIADVTEDKLTKDSAKDTSIEDVITEDKLVKDSAIYKFITDVTEDKLVKDSDKDKFITDVTEDKHIKDSARDKFIKDVKLIMDSARDKFIKDVTEEMDVTEEKIIKDEEVTEDKFMNDSIDDNLIQEVEEMPLRDMWKEINGCNNWEGLLDPISSNLRKEIIRYGEFAQACYDAFDFDPHSKYCGTCKYSGGRFFEKLDMADRGYEISRYLYATSNINLPNFFQHSKLSSVWSQHANWMGYVAVATDEEEIKRLGRRDIVVAWRGTVTYLEWIHDLKDILHPAQFSDDPSIKIESGFFDLYTVKEHTCKYCSFSAREQLLAEIKKLVERYKNEELSITITGHSLGAALAILGAYDIAELKLNAKDGSVNGEAKIPITVFSFAGPRVGNLKFKERCDELGVKVLRVINTHDKVPTVPGIIANEKFKHQKYLEDALAFPWSYAHVGVELALDHKKSPFLRPKGGLDCLHNLEALLHLVDGYHGEGKEFCLVHDRDIALVNKSCNFLKEEYGVPPHWRQDENKGMIRNDDGRWVVPERPRIEALPPDTADHIKQLLKLPSLPTEAT